MVFDRQEIKNHSVDLYHILMVVKH